jgi:hypothetical protein
VPVLTRHTPANVLHVQACVSTCACVISARPSSICASACACAIAGACAQPVQVRAITLFRSLCWLSVQVSSTCAQPLLVFGLYQRPSAHVFVPRLVVFVSCLFHLSLLSDAK